MNHSDMLQITLVQPDILWEDIPANLLQYDQLLDGLTTDIVLLPETFSTGFTMNASAVAETMYGRTIQWMSEKARLLNSVIAGSLVVKEDNHYHNRFIWMQPSGDFYSYDKRHLFRMGGEQEVYTPGHQQLVIPYKGWFIMPLICYDLRFPVWSRQTSEQPYDLLLYVANWPQARNYAWTQLLRARAIENLAYVAGVNRVGVDGSGVYHSGNSALLNYKGEEIWTQADAIAVSTHTLSLTDLKQFRQQFPAHLDADGFSLAF